MNDGGVNWDDAQKNCDNNGADLGKITKDLQSGVALSYAKFAKKDLWIGLRSRIRSGVSKNYNIS